MKRKTPILTRPASPGSNGRAENGPGVTRSPLCSRADLLRQRMVRLWQRRTDLIRKRVKELKEHRSSAATERELVMVTAKIMDLEMRQEKNSSRCGHNEAVDPAVTEAKRSANVAGDNSGRQEKVAA